MTPMETLTQAIDIFVSADLTYFDARKLAERIDTMSATLSGPSLGDPGSANRRYAPTKPTGYVNIP